MADDLLPHSIVGEGRSKLTRSSKIPGSSTIQVLVLDADSRYGDMASAWAFSYKEARAIALIVAVVLWSLAAFFWLAGSGYRSLAGPLKGGDFVFFYTLGNAARADDPALLYDQGRLHALQASLVAESAPDEYLPVYPPHTALVYVPFSYLPFGLAASLWTLLIVLAYAAVVNATWHRVRDALPDGWFVAVAAAAFPPFWNLVVHGHNTIVPLVAFFGAWLALERGQRFVAGLILGLIFLKPQFGLALAVVVLLGREWAIVAGLAVSGALQLLLMTTVYDLSMLTHYLQFMQRVAAVEYLIEPKPWEMHSMRAVTRLLPAWLDSVVWVAASAVVLHGALRIWTRAESWPLRMAGLVLATVLISPHLFAYDATVLVLPLLWIGAWVQRHHHSDAALVAHFWPIVIGLYATLLIPFARIILLQPSVWLMIWLLWLLHAAVVRRATDRPRPATRHGSPDCI